VTPSVGIDVRNRETVRKSPLHARPTLLSLLLVAVVLTPVTVVGRMASHRPCLAASDVTRHQAPCVLRCSCCKAGEPGDQPGIVQGRVEVNVDQQMLAVAVPGRFDAGRPATHLARFDASPPHRSSVTLFVLLADLRL
jgi:hypothetical protein